MAFLGGWWLTIIGMVVELDKPVLLFLKLWPVHTFKKWPFSSYIGADSESHEELVFHIMYRNIVFFTNLLERFDLELSWGQP